MKTRLLNGSGAFAPTVFGYAVDLAGSDCVRRPRIGI